MQQRGFKLRTELTLVKRENLFNHKESEDYKTPPDCSLLEATAKLDNYNTISIPKYNENGNTKAQATQR